jgi:hypothetical protein
MAQNKLFTIDSGDIKGFFLGIVTAIIGVYVLDKFKEKNGKLEYGEKRLLHEVKELKEKIDHIQTKS